MSLYCKEKVLTAEIPMWEKLAALLAERKVKGHCDLKANLANHEVRALAESLYGISNAIFNGWDVWAELEKEPRGNLDTGRHYWSVYYIADNQRHRFWPHNSELARFLGMREWNRDYSMPKWSFSSGAIGMSRLLDATDMLFHVIEACGGCKGVQLT